MKRIILMRHGEARNVRGSESDRDRPLTDSGKVFVEDVAAQVVDEGWQPQHIVCSSAVRTRETLSVFQGKMTTEVETVFSDYFYLGSLDHIVDEVAGLASDIATILLVGHNPGWSEAITALSGKFYGLRPGEAALLSMVEPDWANAISSLGNWQFEKCLKSRS